MCADADQDAPIASAARNASRSVIQVPPTRVTPRANSGSGRQPAPGPISAKLRACEQAASMVSRLSLRSRVLVAITLLQVARSLRSMLTRQPSRSPARSARSSTTVSLAPAFTMPWTSGGNSPIMPM